MSKELVNQIFTEVKPYLEEVGGGEFTDSPEYRTAVEYFLDKLMEIIEATLEEKYKGSYPTLKEVRVRAYSDCNDEGGVDGATVQVVFVFVKEKPYGRVEALLYSLYWSLDEIKKELERLINSLIDGVENSLVALPVKCVE